MTPGLYHDFYLIPVEKCNERGYHSYMHAPGAIVFSDDFLGYLNDTIAWIPTFNPAWNGKVQQGLNFTGVTAIGVEGAPACKAVFQAWADLFSAGPSVLHVTGGFSWIEGEPPESGSYERLRLDRDQVVKSLRDLAGFANQVIQSEGKQLILHFGV